MISPKSKLKALVMKLLTVMVKPEVNAKRHPRANLILALLLSLANSSSDKRLSSTEKKNLFLTTRCLVVIVSTLLIFFIFFLQGCYDAVRDKVLSNLQIVIGVSVGVLALQILGIIFAFCLCKAIGNDRDYHYKY